MAELSFPGTDISSPASSLCQECDSRKLWEHNNAALVHHRRILYVSASLAIVAIIISVVTLILFVVLPSCCDSKNSAVDKLRTGTFAPLRSHREGRRKHRKLRENSVTTPSCLKGIIRRLVDQDGKLNTTHESLDLKRESPGDKVDRTNKRRRRQRQKRVMSAHFIPKPVADEKFGRDGCIYQNDIRICNNHTATNFKSGDVLRAVARSIREVAQALRQSMDISCKVLAQYNLRNRDCKGKASFMHTNYRDSLRVLSNANVLMNCVQSQTDIEYQTCSINGAFYLDEGSDIEVKFPYSGTQINIKPAYTYFGLVKLN